MKLIIYVVLTVFAYSISFSQESGWADSLGYKQQKLKTGAVQQVRFTPSGDSIISIAKDTSWHLHIWNAYTGKLLSSQHFHHDKEKKVVSVWLAEDSKTYSIVTQKKDSIFIHVNSTDKQSLLSYTFVKLKDVTWSIAYYSLQTNNMWLVCNTYLNANTSWGPTGTNGGMLYHFQLKSKTWVEKNKYDGSSFYVNFGKNYTLCSRMAYYRDVYYDRGQIVRHKYWFSSELIGDSLLYRRYFNNNPSESEWDNIEVYLLRNSFITQDGNQFFNINVKSLAHYSQPLWNYTSTIEMNKFPYYIKSLQNNQHILISQNQFSYLYHIGLHKITDTLIMPFLFNSCSQLNNSELFAFASKDGYIRLNAISTKNNSTTDFRTSRTIMYPDTSIAFFPITKQGAKQFHWDFGDGTSSQEQYPSHIYANTGEYTITLRVSYTNRPEDTIVKKNHILIEPHLIPKFSANSVMGTPPFEVHFTDQSLGNLKKWLWDFGDGTKDTVQNPKHIYKEQGTYYVSLTITDKIRSKTTLISTLITTTPYTLDSILVKEKYRDKTENYHYGKFKNEYNKNFYLKGYYSTSLNQLLLFRLFEVYTDAYDSGKDYHYYYSGEQLMINTNKTLASRIPNDKRGDGYIKTRTLDEGYTINYYRNGIYVTTFDVMLDYYIYESKQSSIYFTDKREFAPNGWSHNFDGVFFPDETDVFLFRKKGDSASLQFFANRDSLIRRIQIKAQFSRIFSSKDSNTLILVSNPSFSISDSTRYFTITHYDLNGNSIRQNTIEKKTDCAISDIYSVGNNEFLLCGYSATKDTLGKLSKQQGYIVKINADGWIVWEQFLPTWKSIRKIERHPNGYFAGFGLPFEKNKHGYIAFRSDGKLLSDYRLFQASSSFYAYDFVIGNNENEIWFIGSEEVSGQGERGTLYTCSNPVTPTTDIEEKTDEKITTNDFSVFPNPAHSSITVRDYKGEISLINTMGIVVERSYAPVIDIQHLPNGVYFVKAADMRITKLLSIVR